MRATWVLTTVVLATVCDAGAAQATPVAASMSLTAVAAMDDQVTVTQTSSDSWGTLLSPLAFSALAHAFDPDSTAELLTGGSGAATWSPDGDSGSVIFSDYFFEGTPGATGYGISWYTGGPDWSYTFLADSNGFFSMSYDVTAASSASIGPFALGGWDIDWSGPGGGANLIDAFDPTTSGVFTRSIQAGNTYTISLQNNTNLLARLVGPPGPSSMDGEFDFSIQSAPEPASIAIVLGGLGWFAYQRRRVHRRKNG